jgi:hypothetical protein
MILVSILIYLQVVFAATSFNDKDYGPGRILTRDVLIIGGGSSGTYSAIRLQEQGKTVCVVEKEPVLGGHTNTYIDPVTKAPVDHGVQVWMDIPVVNNYFRNLNFLTTTVNVNLPPFIQYVADFSADQIVPTSALPPENITLGLEAYVAQLAKYPYLNNGFDLPNPVPADLLLPFGDFVNKYQLQSIVPLLFDYAQGSGNMLAQLTLYILKLIHSVTISAIVNGDFLTSAIHNNHQLYDLALQVLGSNVLLNSTTLGILRSGNSVLAAILTPSGPMLVKAKQLVSKQNKI